MASAIAKASGPAVRRNKIKNPDMVGNSSLVCVECSRRSLPTHVTQKAVCFSEVPPGQWKRLVDRRGTKYGLAFEKNYVIAKGGGLIWYVWKDTPHWQLLQSMMDSATGDVDAPIWRLAPMIDAPGSYGPSKYEFDWEREWRHVGPLSFSADDVAFLLIPEKYHESARSFFEEARVERLGPAYLCPYVDPEWDRDRILKVLAS